VRDERVRDERVRDERVRDERVRDERGRDERGRYIQDERRVCTKRDDYDIEHERNHYRKREPEEYDNRPSRYSRYENNSRLPYDRNEQQHDDAENKVEPTIKIERKTRDKDRKKSLEFRLEKDNHDDDGSKKRVGFKAPQKTHMAFFPDVNDDGDVIDDDLPPISPKNKKKNNTRTRK
jgi:hypothetical protein